MPVCAALLTTLFWSASTVCAARSARLLGPVEANFWRLLVSVLLLAVWALTLGQGLFGPGLALFVVSGLIGVGIGDTAFFQSLPRVGARLTLLLVTCLTPPFGALIEWMWLGTALTGVQMLFGLVALVGVATALAPARHLELRRNDVWVGAAFSALAALGGAVGAVLSRKGYAVVQAAGGHLDGGTAAFERLLGGFGIAALCLALACWREIRAGLAGHGTPVGEALLRWKGVWMWVAANGLFGQALGVSTYQWALEQLPTGVVLSVVSLTPLTVIPIALVVEGERPTRHSLAGTVVAVAGVIGLVLGS